MYRTTRVRTCTTDYAGRHSVNTNTHLLHLSLPANFRSWSSIRQVDGLFSTTWRCSRACTYFEVVYAYLVLRRQYSSTNSVRHIDCRLYLASPSTVSTPTCSGTVFNLSYATQPLQTSYSRKMPWTRSRTRLTNTKPRCASLGLSIYKYMAPKTSINGRVTIPGSASASKFVIKSSLPRSRVYPLTNWINPSTFTGEEFWTSNGMSRVLSYGRCTRVSLYACDSYQGISQHRIRAKAHLHRVWLKAATWYWPPSPSTVAVYVLGGQLLQYPVQIEVL